MDASKSNIIIYDSEVIQRKIYTIRNSQVMLDRDLAEFYGVETKVLNQAVKRNIERFPQEFMFQLTKDELNDWKSQIVTSNKEKMGLRKLPNVFTEQGVAMLSAVLRSDTAVKMSIQIMNAFVAMRKFIINNAQIFQRINTVEKRQIKLEMETDEKFEKVFNALQKDKLDPKQGIFFDGQIFDAHYFVSGLIRKAEKSIVLIDNYINDSILHLFTKRKKEIAVTIYTANLTNALLTDVKKFNAQYPQIEVKEFKNSHDRFMIIDDEDVYHFGASLKDLGKKWFAFSKFDKQALVLLQKLGKEV